MTPVYVTGRAVWTPGFPSAETWLSGQRDPDADKPPCEAVPSRLRRWISMLSRMLIETATQACTDAGAPASEVATVFGSSHGEIQIAIKQMAMMKEGDGKVSPACFKNSVHNTATGLLSISSENRGFATALAAGPDTVAACLVEAAALLADGEAHVVIALGDEALPEPIEFVSEHAPASVALVLSASPTPNAPSLRLHSEDPGTAAAVPDLPAPLASNPCAPALRLIQALAAKDPGALRMGPGPLWVSLDWEDAA